MNYPPQIPRKIINGRELVCVTSLDDLFFPPSEQAPETSFLDETFEVHEDATPEGRSLKICEKFCRHVRFLHQLKSV